MVIRPYSTTDYDQVAVLYKQGHLYGGQFDENRDSFEKLQKITERDPEAILVAEDDGKILGTISLIKDGRVAWLFRFAVTQGEHEAEITAKLYEKAIKILRARGHTQVLVYSPTGNKNLDNRYRLLGFNRGRDYTAFWQDM
jgi:predicted N-acetyltransferase YhbS